MLFHCSQIMTRAVAIVRQLSHPPVTREWASAACCKSKHKWQENEFSSGGVMACHWETSSTTNIWAGLCWVFNACRVCVEMGRTAWQSDPQPVGSLSEGSVWTVKCGGAIMTEQRSLSLQSKWSQTGTTHTCNHVKHLNHGEVYVGSIHGLSSYLVLFSAALHPQWPRTVTVTSSPPSLKNI